MIFQITYFTFILPHSPVMLAINGEHKLFMGVFPFLIYQHDKGSKPKTCMKVSDFEFYNVPHKVKFEKILNLISLLQYHRKEITKKY